MAQRKHGKGDEGDLEAPASAEAAAELAVAAAGFTLKLPKFEGPLDLLLHLIREHELDLFDIPIAFIADEYMKYLDRMRELNLDVAGEFLVMAATLAHLKSKLLLPKEEKGAEDAVEEDPGDPRAELVKRLLEYQKYRTAADDLARRDLLGRNVFARSVRADQVPLDSDELGVREVSVFKLIEAFDVVLQRLEPEKQHEVRLDRTTITQEIHRIMERLRATPELAFHSLFDGMTERHQVIAAFLGLLELTRLKLVRVLQLEVDGEIVIRATERLGEEASLDVRDDFR